MKIDIHDITGDMLVRGANGGGVVETTIIGTANDGTPACATVHLTARHLAKR